MYLMGKRVAKCNIHKHGKIKIWTLNAIHRNPYQKSGNAWKKIEIDIFITTGQGTIELEKVQLC